MEAFDAEAFAEIEAMRLFAGDAGDQLDFAAAERLRLVLQPCDQLRAIAERAGVFIRDQVVDKQRAAAIQHVHDAIGGHGRAVAAHSIGQHARQATVMAA